MRTGFSDSVSGFALRPGESPTCIYRLRVSPARPEHHTQIVDWVAGHRPQDVHVEFQGSSSDRPRSFIPLGNGPNSVEAEMRDLKQEAGNLFGDGIENGTVPRLGSKLPARTVVLVIVQLAINVDNRTPSHHPCSP
jgi:hypothetical protein